VDENNQQIQPTPPIDSQHENTPGVGGGLPVIKYWAEHTLSPEGINCIKVLAYLVPGGLGDKKEDLPMKREKNCNAV